jgi:rhodanese-related sulfurtransferase
MTTVTIDDVISDARQQLRRLYPHQALAATETGALLVDIRPAANRELEGTIPGAVVIDRNVLEWRLDPASAASLEIASYDLVPVLFCNEGYASTLAAASLQQLGIRGATDLVGGYRAWRAAGLPTHEPVAGSSERRPFNHTVRSAAGIGRATR